MSISSVYEKYFGLGEHPFSITPDPRFVYLSDKHRAALEHLKQGAVGGANGFVLLTGDVGTGKTTLCRTFLEQVPPKTEVALILNPVLTLNEFLQTICEELDLVIEGSRESNKNLIDHLNRFLVQVYALGQKTILIVDEAQDLSHELLEQIRLLTNLETNSDKLLLIFLIGQPELRDILDRPDMQQVSQRITSRYHLGPLDKEETRAYIERRLEVAGGSDIEFTASAIRRIYAFSGGVPRLINVLCDKALLCAYENATQKITGTIIKEAEERVRGNLTRSSSHWGRKAAGIAMAGIALAAIIVGVGYWIQGTGWPPEFGPSSETTAIVDKRAAAPVVASADTQPDPAAASNGTGERNETGSPFRTDRAESSNNKVAMTAVSQGQSTAKPSPEKTDRSEPAAVLAESSTASVSLPLPQTSQGGPTAATQLPASDGEAPAESKAKIADMPADLAGTMPSAGAASLASTPIASDAANPTTPSPGSGAGDATGGFAADSVARTQSEPTQRAPSGGMIPKEPPSPTTTVAALDDARAASAIPESQSSDMLTEHVEGITATPSPDSGSAQGRSDTATTADGPQAGTTPSPTMMAKATKGRIRGEGATAAQSQARPKTKQPSRRAKTLTSYTRTVAERKLLNLWGVPGDPPANMSLCQFARQNGLDCLSDSRGLKFLYIFNRPALVSIRVDNLKSYAVVTKATPEKVVLDVLDRTHEIPAKLFPNIWDGRFVVLYRAPKEFRGALTPGYRGEKALRVRQIMDQIEGKQTSGDAYDPELVSRVKQFQRSIGLKPDGIVGPRTLMVMRNKLAKLKQ